MRNLQKFTCTVGLYSCLPVFFNVDNTPTAQRLSRYQNYSDFTFYQTFAAKLKLPFNAWLTLKCIKCKRLLTLNKPIADRNSFQFTSRIHGSLNLQLKGIVGYPWGSFKMATSSEIAPMWVSAQLKNFYSICNLGKAYFCYFFCLIIFRYVYCLQLFCLCLVYFDTRAQDNKKRCCALKCTTGR